MQNAAGYGAFIPPRLGYSDCGQLSFGGAYARYDDGISARTVIPLNA